MTKLAENEIRLFFDENMPDAVAKRLNELGIDTVTTPSHQRQGKSDPNQLEYATAAGRVLCAYDRDYGVLVRYFTELKRIYSPADMENRLEYLFPTMRD